MRCSAPNKSVYMVFEYCNHDLTGLLDTDPPIVFTAPQIKHYMKGIFEGLYYLHKKMKILHRDIKGYYRPASKKISLLVPRHD